MKSRLRFVLILGILGLLTSMMVAIPAFADTGKVTLKGGALDSSGVAEGKFFSDKQGFNIVTATTEDSDLSPTRQTTATFRFANPGVAALGADQSLFTLKDGAAVVGLLKSEKDKIIKFSGTGTSTAFSLGTDRGRDREDDGDLDVSDVVAKVSGTTVTVSAVTINAGGYITSVTLLNAPAAGTDNVEITIGISEFDQTDPTKTPISSASVNFGPAFNNTPNIQGASSINNIDGTISTTSIAATNFVKITFDYNVKETKTELMTFTTPTLGARGLTRKLDGVETTFSSNKFEVKVALFSGSDFDKIKTAADATGADTIDEILADASIDAALDARITAAATALGFTNTAAADSGDNLVEQLLPIADGDVLTVSYVDADPAGTRTATADIDMKAPTITQVSPAQSAFSNSLSQTLVLEVTDEPSVGGKRSGLDSTAVDEILVKTAQGGPTGTTLVPLFLGENSFRVSLSKQFAAADEGVVEWHIVTMDKVGNAPTDTGSSAVLGTSGKPFKFNLDITAAKPTAASASRPVVTGGKIDTRFAVALTGSVTLATTPTTVLEDANAKFQTNGVKVGDKITNTTDASTATVVTVDSETQITHSALSNANTWAVGEGYKIENPMVNTVASSSTAVSAVSIFYDLGTGKAPIDDATATASDFLVGGAAPASITVGAVDTVANEQGILLTLAAPLATTDKPKVEQSGAMLDKAGNTIATFTGNNALTSTDGLAPVVNLTVTGTAASRAVTNDEVTIKITANEDTGTPTVGVYTVGSATNTGNAVGANVTVPALKFVTTRSWEVDVTPGAGLYSVFAKATDTGGNTGKAGVEGLASDDTDKAVTGVQIDLTKAVLFEKDTGIPTPTMSPASTSNRNPFISANFAGEGKEYGLAKCTGSGPGVPNVNCTAADVTAGRGFLSSDPTLITTSFDEHKTVTLVSASLDGADVTSQVNTADSVIFLYRGTDLTIGDHTFVIRVRDASGNEREFTQTVKVTERALFKLNVVPGWNMISFPGSPADPSVAAVIGNTPITTIYSFAPTTAVKWLVATRERMADGTFGPFQGNLTTIEPNRAYWVLTTTFEPIQVDIPPLQGGADPGSTPVTPPTVPIVVGWNFVPIIDITGSKSAGDVIDSDVYFAGQTTKISRIYIFDTQTSTWTLITPDGVQDTTAAAITASESLIVGKAYWVYATSAFTLVP